MRGIANGAAAALFLSLLAARAPAAPDDGTAPATGSQVSCPLPKPTLAGPNVIRPGETYSLSWTGVLGSATNSGAYTVQRSFDAGFSAGVEQYSTGRTSMSFPAVVLPGPTATVLYHRVSVKSPCPAQSPALVVSDVLAVPVRTGCPTPAAPGGIRADPANPPAGTSYVVSWNGPLPGTPATDEESDDLKFRLRRTSGDAVKEWVTEGHSASFVDAAGTYQYEVRAEASCGAAGPWTPSLFVVVAAPPPNLILVVEPKPIIVVAGPGTASASTSFGVRNTGAGLATVSVSSDSAALVASPAKFSLAPNQVVFITVTLAATQTMAAGATATITLDAGGGVVLAVPVSFLVASAPAVSLVVWSQPDAEVNARGDPIQRTIVNPNATPAAFTAVIRQPWLSIASLDRQAWDRPMSAGEVRGVEILIDRTKRSSPTGTDTGTISLMTAGAPGGTSDLVVVDDGVSPPVTASPGAPGATGAPTPTRILFPSLANTPDGKGVGWFSSDVWVTNSDAVSAADIALILTPVARSVVAGPGVAPVPPVPTVHRIDVTLAPGETRHFRNILNTAGLVGASSLEVRSNATTVSATAVVMNQPLSAAAAGGAVAYASAGSPPIQPPPRVFGAEMRPVAPGEGAKVSDPEFVVSGLAYDANRRSNLLLAETSGLDTVVRVQLYQSNGAPVTKGGQPVDFSQVVPAGQTVQINYPDLFDDTATYASPYSYAIVTYQPGGGSVGSVVPLATVLDNRTQDFSLHVGASVRSLDPTRIPAAQLTAGAGVAFAGGAATTSLPYNGGPSPLFFPVGHAIGAPLAGGVQPNWRTRVTLTNTSGSLQRQVQLTFVDKMGNGTAVSTFVGLAAGSVFSFEDLLSPALGVAADGNAFGGVRIDNIQNGDGSWFSTWQDVDVQTEIYTVDPNATTSPAGEFKTGMEGYPYWHGYSSFQSNLGTVQMEGAETSSRYRTNLILQEVGGAPCEVVVAVYVAGSFVPLAQTTIALNAYDYFSRELFHNTLGLDLGELTDVRVVVRQTSGDGVFMAFVSKINLATGDPANIFLRPAMAGTGR